MNRCKLFLQVSLLWIGVMVASVAYGATASWEPVTDPSVKGYRLYRAPGACDNPGAFATVNTYGVVSTGPVAVPVTNGTYCHRLTAFNDAGESPFSNTVEFQYVVNPPPAPRGLSVTR